MKQLLQKNLSELLRFSTAMSGDRANAEDIVQTAIEKILKNYPDLNDNTEFLKISYRVIRNLFIDTKRKKTRLVSKEDLGNKNSTYSLKDNGDQDLPIEDYIEYNARDVDEDIKYKSINAEDQMIEKELKIAKYKKFEIAQICLSSLKNELQKSVLTLFSEGLKYDEIAERLDIAQGTVKSSLARARIAVIDCIKKRLKND